MTRNVVVTTDEGFRLSCTVSGSGGRLLIGLHGGPGGDGGGYLDPLHRLAGADRTVVTFDQLGTGKSDVPGPEYEWTVRGAAADVEAVRRHFATELGERLGGGLGATEILGHSWGGMLALQYVLDRPSRADRLVLSNTAASTARITIGFLDQLRATLSASETAAAITADMLGDHDSPAYRSAVTRWLARFATEGDMDAAELATAEALSPGPAGRGLWGYRLWFADGALRDWDVEARLAEIAVPTLVVHGGRDMSDASTNRVMAEGIPGAEWLTLNHNGHTIFEAANADCYLALIRAFLDGWPLSAEEESGEQK